MNEIRPGIFVFPGAINCGIVLKDDSALVIDTGLDKEAGRKILRALGNNKLKVIINTHAHADHFGGNEFLVKRTETEVWASAPEGAGMENPIFEPYYLSAGSYPVKEMLNRFFLASRSDVQRKLAGGQRVEEWNLEVIDLPGHSIAQIGIGCGDVLFTGDAFLGADALEKHRIPFNVNITAHLETLEQLTTTEYGWYVPAHGEVKQREGMLLDIEANVERIELILDLILQYLKSGPKGLEDVTKHIADYFLIVINNPGQYYLYRTSINAYLTHLSNSGVIKPLFSDNNFLWEKA